MKDLKSVFNFQIRICSDTENMTNVYTYWPFSYCIDYRRSERVGPFIRICRPDRTENESCPGRNCQQIQMCGDESLKEISEKSLFDKLTCEWIWGKYSFYKSLLALYNSRRIIILLTSMQCFHRGYVAEFCTLAPCSRSSNKNGDDFDFFFYDSCHI